VIYDVGVFPCISSADGEAFGSTHRHGHHESGRLLPVKFYIDNFMRLWSCIRNVNNR
jgi:hypothetical protein